MDNGNNNFNNGNYNNNYSNNNSGNNSNYGNNNYGNNNYSNNNNSGNYNNANNYGGQNTGGNGYYYGNRQPMQQPPVNQQPPNQQPPKKKKSRMGVGILVGVLITVGVILLAAVIGFFIFMTSSLNRTKYNSATEKLESIQTYLDNYYLGELDDQKLEDGLAAGLLDGTGDDYAEYYSAKEFQELLDEISGSYCGIGISIVQNEDDSIEVYKVFKNSPAEEVGIHLRDIIVEVDGTRDFENVNELADLVRGEEGTQVEVTVLRDGEEQTFTITRRLVDIETVNYEMLDGNIGYIELSEFEVISVDQFNEALDALEAEGATSLIIDLRDNPGGDYDTVIAIADRVLPEGPIVRVKNKQGTEKVEESDEEHQVTVPMVLLVNNNSASASELFSAAVKDFGAATIIGETTYGKGVIQSIFQLSDGSGMKFTTEEYLSPDGKQINGIGVSPDIEVTIPEEAYDDGIISEEEDTQLQKAIEVLSGSQEASIK